MTPAAGAGARPAIWWILGGLLLVFAAWRILVLALDPDLQPDAPLFLNKDGSPISYSAARLMLRRVLDLAGALPR